MAPLLALALAAALIVGPGPGGRSGPRAEDRTSAPTPIELAELAADVRQGAVTIQASDPYSQEVLSATGIILSRSGEVLTNNHVIEGTTRIEVRIGGVGPTYPAGVLGSDAAADVAVLQLRGAPPLHPLPVGDSGLVRAGDAVVAIGNTGEGPPAASAGSVTAVDCSVAATDPATQTPETLKGMFELEVPVQPGSSGGPVVTPSGRVVAMTTAGEVIVDGLVPADAAFAIPIAAALKIAGRIESGRGGQGIQVGPQAFLGVEAETYIAQQYAGPPPMVTVLSDVTGHQGADLSRLSGAGALVLSIVPRSPAAAAGLGPGDVITALDDQVVSSATALLLRVEAHRPGQTVVIRWVGTTGEVRSAPATLAAGPAS